MGSASRKSPSRQVRSGSASKRRRCSLPMATFLTSSRSNCSIMPTNRNDCAGSFFSASGRNST